MEPSMCFNDILFSSLFFFYATQVSDYGPQAASRSVHCIVSLGPRPRGDIQVLPFLDPVTQVCAVLQQQGDHVGATQHHCPLQRGEPGAVSAVYGYVLALQQQAQRIELARGDGQVQERHSGPGKKRLWTDSGWL